MLGTIAIVPSAPILVPQLAGAAATELSDLRAAAMAAVEVLPERWIAVGAGPVAGLFGPEAVGTFAGFGADITVALSPNATQPARLPLAVLIAGWLRGAACPQARVHAHVWADPDTAVGQGERLRAEINGSPDPIGVLIVADGANTLTAAAPGGHRPGDIGVQRALDDALAGGDAAALTELPPQVGGRAGFSALAGLARPAPRATKELYRGAPYGVGYFVGLWQP